LALCFVGAKRVAGQRHIVAVKRKVRGRKLTPNLSALTQLSQLGEKSK
jgi:hypothetical protein